MNKEELIARVAEKASMPKSKVEPIVEATFDSILDSIYDDEKVRIVGFGIFDVKERAEKSGRNPRTGETIIIPARKAPVFDFSDIVKKEINWRNK